MKGIHFIDIQEARDPIECVRAYRRAGTDELALHGIIATVENRPTMLEVLKKVVEVTTGQRRRMSLYTTFLSVFPRCP